jgi:hypothetical protein
VWIDGNDDDDYDDEHCQYEDGRSATYKADKFI